MPTGIYKRTTKGQNKHVKKVVQSEHAIRSASEKERDKYGKFK